MIERTQDYRILNRLLPWQPDISNEVFYLLEVEKGEPVGVWSCYQFDKKVIIHADMGPKCRGKKAIDSAKRAFKWLFKNVPIDIICANIKKERKAACQIAARSGMELVCMENELKFYKVVDHG